MHGVITVARHDMTWLRRDPAPLVTLLVTPCVLMVFIKPLYVGVLDQLGYRGANGAELAVPGIASMFAFFMAGVITESVFREHGLNTWQRLQISPMKNWEVLLGKVAPCAVLVLAQLVVLFGLGALLSGLRVQGSLLALGLLMLALAVCVVSFGLALCSLSRTRRQAFAYERVTTLGWAVFGGALVPAELMADWVGWVARATPVHWAVDGFREVILDGRGITEVLPQVGALLGFAAVFATVGLTRFDAAEDRRHWD